MLFNKRVLVAAAFSVLGVFSVTAQQEHVHTRTCAAHDKMVEHLAANPRFALNQQEIERFTKEYEESGQFQRNAQGTITIPVVVHVVYNTTAENISDAQINSQITVLNADFAATNTDYGSTPSTFQSVRSGNTGIQFCLAQRDPSGNATTEIGRASCRERV